MTKQLRFSRSKLWVAIRALLERQGLDVSVCVMTAIHEDQGLIYLWDAGDRLYELELNQPLYEDVDVSPVAIVGLDDYTFEPEEFDENQEEIRFLRKHRSAFEALNERHRRMSEGEAPA
jgi:hypothetical protein